MSFSKFLESSSDDLRELRSMEACTRIIIIIIIILHRNSEPKTKLSENILNQINICNWIYKKHPYLYSLYFEKYYFEILKQLWFSHATL